MNAIVITQMGIESARNILRKENRAMVLFMQNSSAFVYLEDGFYLGTDV